MSVQALLTQPVTIHRYRTGQPDEYGNVEGWWVSDPGTINARMEPRASIERSEDRQTVVSDWALFLPPDTVIHPRDRVTDRFGRLFEVVGAPAMQSTPLEDIYVEVSLRHVDSA